MAYTFPRVGKNGKTRYTGIYQDITGRNRSAGTFDTEKRALREAIEAEADAQAGRSSDPQRSKVTLRVYVTQDWTVHHQVEKTTMEGYRYLLDRYILPELGDLKLCDIDPERVRRWVTRLSTVHKAQPPTIRNVKVLFDSIMSTLTTDRVIPFHPGRGVKTPPVASKPRRIIDVAQYQRLRDLLPDDELRLMVETDIETGLRWGELSELRVRDIDFSTGMLTVSRVVIHLRAVSTDGGPRFEVKHYPKDKKWRQLKLAAHLVAKLREHVTRHDLGRDDLLFRLPQVTGPARRRRPAELPDPLTLGFTDPNEKGRTYRHGTLTAYQAGKCRCQHCKDAVATYRAERRAAGKDDPRKTRATRTDDDQHLSNDWFRHNVWNPAVDQLNLGFRITPHSLRHAHASWLLAGGADLQVVKERLGHGSITTTEKYLHTLPNRHDAALDALDNIRQAPAPKTSQREQVSAAVAAPPSPHSGPGAAPATTAVTGMDPTALLAALGPDVVRQVLTGLLQQVPGAPTGQPPAA